MNLTINKKSFYGLYFKVFSGRYDDINASKVLFNLSIASLLVNSTIDGANQFNYCEV